jgi:hypothetical protein
MDKNHRLRMMFQRCINHLTHIDRGLVNSAFLQCFLGNEAANNSISRISSSVSVSAPLVSNLSRIRWRCLSV